MSSNFSTGKQESAYFDTGAPNNCFNVTAGTSATFQCATANLDRLYRLTAKVDIWVIRGTGAAVTAPTSVTGHLLIAGQELYFTCNDAQTSVGIATVDGSAFSATAIASFGCVTHRTYPRVSG